MKRIILAIFLTLIICITAAAADNYAMFLKLSGVAGEALFQNDPGWISLTSFKIGPDNEETGDIAKPIIMALPSRISGPETEMIGRLDGMSVQLTKYVDKCSPAIAQSFQRNRRFPGGKLCLCSPSDHTKVTYMFEFTGVKITHLKETGNQQILTLNFEKIEFKS